MEKKTPGTDAGDATKIITTPKYILGDIASLHLSHCLEELDLAYIYLLDVLVKEKVVWGKSVGIVEMGVCMKGREQKETF